MSDKITEIQNKWDEGCETGVMDAGDLFGSLLDVAYELEHELVKAKALATSEVKKAYIASVNGRRLVVVAKDIKEASVKLNEAGFKTQDIDDVEIDCIIQ